MERKQGRKLSANEIAKHEEIRRKVKTEFPPKSKSESCSHKVTIADRLREARESQGLTWYAVAKAASIPNSGTIRDIESGRDAKLSNIEAIAKVLGLKLELQSAGQGVPG
jgi:ribosome-binding protein aMBF1 (putative translation factor)